MVATMALVGLGFGGSFSGIVLSVVAMVMYGGKFGARHKVLLPQDQQAPHQEYTFIDGPSESYILVMWILTMAQVIFALLNIIGPASCFTRPHFLVQAIAVPISAVYIIVVTFICRDWPEIALSSCPSKMLYGSGGLLLVGQFFLAASALRLSGSGWGPKSEQKRRSRGSGRSKWVPVLKSNSGYRMVNREIPSDFQVPESDEESIDEEDINGEYGYDVEATGRREREALERSRSSDDEKYEHQET
eukprot:CAMPEP_0113880002 /NCGR_PEP_ID=MMETSP0780_2-20120614/7544_1 /TAXON_ID=652834 /ORGANISM="Palpitomonas bilix" /LENGTH=245 /DNA_ID=CAMNT_0000866631 /DNA_START=129 /DNA_END=866 /DNA_ORIENTATION=- /assembly_acc=CAM_ASM_000599